MLLDPDDAADDQLTLQLHLCSGKAELWADATRAPSLNQPTHQYSSTYEPSTDGNLAPLVLSASALAGRSFW